MKLNLQRPPEYLRQGFAPSMKESENGQTKDYAKQPSAAILALVGKDCSRQSNIDPRKLGLKSEHSDESCGREIIEYQWPKLVGRNLRTHGDGRLGFKNCRFIGKSFRIKIHIQGLRFQAFAYFRPNCLGILFFLQGRRPKYGIVKGNDRLWKRDRADRCEQYLS